MSPVDIIRPASQEEIDLATYKIRSPTVRKRNDEDLILARRVKAALEKTGGTVIELCNTDRNGVEARKTITTVKGLLRGLFGIDVITRTDFPQRNVYDRDYSGTAKITVVDFSRQKKV